MCMYIVSAYGACNIAILTANSESSSSSSISSRQLIQQIELFPLLLSSSGFDRDFHKQISSIGLRQYGMLANVIYNNKKDRTIADFLYPKMNE